MGSLVRKEDEPSTEEVAIYSKVFTKISELEERMGRKFPRKSRISIAASTAKKHIQARLLKRPWTHQHQNTTLSHESINNFFELVGIKAVETVETVKAVKIVEVKVRQTTLDMSNQLFAAKKPCNNCGGLISWDKRIREQKGTNLPLNLDSTIHDRDSCNQVKLEHPGLPTEMVAGVINKNLPEIEEAKITAALRTEGWNKAHDENMEEGKLNREESKLNREENKLGRLQTASLTDAILETRQELHEMNTNLKTLCNIITAYIEQK